LYQIQNQINFFGKSINIANIQSQIDQAKEKNTLYMAKLDKVKKVDNFVRYDIAKYIWSQVKFFNRYSNTKNLIAIYEKLKVFSINNQLILSNFIIKNDSVQIKGQVSNMNLMYGSENSPWLISRMSSLKFLNNIQIPYYRKNDNNFEFTLVATLQNANSPSNTGTIKQ
jgi:hypothetical protein